MPISARRAVSLAGRIGAVAAYAGGLAWAAADEERLDPEPAPPAVGSPWIEEAVRASRVRGVRLHAEGWALTPEAEPTVETRLRRVGVALLDAHPDATLRIGLQMVEDDGHALEHVMGVSLILSAVDRMAGAADAARLDAVRGAAEAWREAVRERQRAMDLGAPDPIGAVVRTKGEGPGFGLRREALVQAGILLQLARWEAAGRPESEEAQRRGISLVRSLATALADGDEARFLGEVAGVAPRADELARLLDGVREAALEPTARAARERAAEEVR